MNREKPQVLLVEDDEGHVGLIRRAFTSPTVEMQLQVKGTVSAARDMISHEPPRSAPSGVVT